MLSTQVMLLTFNRHLVVETRHIGINLKTRCSSYRTSKWQEKDKNVTDNIFIIPAL